MSVLEQLIAQLGRMQLHTAQTSSEPSETEYHLHHEIAVLTAQLESLSTLHQGLSLLTSSLQDQNAHVQESVSATLQSAESAGQVSRKRDGT